MADRRVASTNRSCAPGARVLGLAGALLLILPSGASARSIILQSPAESTVDIGGDLVFGYYTAVTQQFELVLDDEVGSIQFLTLRDFFIPNPSAPFVTFSFLIQEPGGDPEDPNSFSDKQDIPITWDTATGRLQGEVRARLTQTGPSGGPPSGDPKTSDFVLMLTTDPMQTGAIECPLGNTNPGRSGVDLPPGMPPPRWASLTLVAGACPDIGAPTNDLPNTIVLLEIAGMMLLPLAEPRPVPLLSGPGRAALVMIGMLVLGGAAARFAGS